MNTQELIEILKKMPRALIGSILISIASIIATALVVIFLLLPEQKRLASAQLALKDKTQENTRMQADLANAAKLKEETAKLEAERDEIVKSHTLVPLLSSMSMRAKTILSPLAEKVGFAIEDVRELPPVRLQLPKEMPDQLYSREPIEFSGRGSFNQIVAFISSTEAAHPYTILSGLIVTPIAATPEIHHAIITFEWPITGEKRSTLVPAKK